MLELNRLFLDTNIYIIGTQDINSDEAKILTAIGYYGKQDRKLESQIIFSAELIDQIRRVGKYLWNKDQAGLVLSLIFTRLDIHYVTPNQEWYQLLTKIRIKGNIPLEDIEIFLTAKYGKANCFISGNRELIKAIADFECLTPESFVKKYL